VPTNEQPEAPRPWQQRFRAERIIGAQLAKGRPERGLVVTNRGGVAQLHAWDVATGELRRLTDKPEGMVVGFIAPDGRHVYYLDDRGGNELGHLVRVPWDGGPPQDMTPELPPYSLAGATVSQAGNALLLTIADASGFSLLAADLALDGTVAPTRTLYHADRLLDEPVVTHGGELTVLPTTERSGTVAFSLVALETETGERVAELWDGAESSLRPVAFEPLPGDRRLLAASNRSGVNRPLLWDPATGEREDVAQGAPPGELVPLDWSDDGRGVLLLHAAQAERQLYAYDLATGHLTPLARNAGYGSFFAPNGEVFALWQDATHPPQVVALDGETGTVLRTVLPAGEVPPGRPWRSVTFPSSDGQAIQGWLAVPAGEGPFPTILYTHGGPTAVATETFSPEAQAWLDHGFAFLSINYRGSTTFGRDFERQLWGDLGHWEIEDMVAARDWLVASGVAHAEQIFPSGWSYGGYLTLLALGKRPDLWAGGLAGVAIADWAMSYEDSADVLRGYQVALFGGTPEEKPDLYRAASPITYAERVNAPVLIIQGRNDTRTPARPIQAYEAKLGALGKPVEVHWFDAGHLGGFAQTEQAIEHQALMLRFAQDVLRSNAARGWAASAGAAAEGAGEDGG